MIHGETGLIQFELHWQRAAAPQGALVDQLIACRNELRRRQLIGITEEGIGYGNVSGRTGASSFVISGTSTGGNAVATADDFTEVVAYDVAVNSVSCRGPVRASAESLSHAAVYDAVPNVKAVIHVHHAPLWRQLYGKLPTTEDTALAGTKELALAIVRLLESNAGAREGGLLVMGGHADGIITFGPTLEAAARRLLAELTT